MQSQYKKLLLFGVAILLVVSLIQFTQSAFWIGTDPTLYYKFNDGSGNATDEMGLSNLTLGTGGGWDAGKLNNSVSLAGSQSTSYINSSDLGSNLAFGTGTFTIAFWINATGTIANNGDLITYGEADVETWDIETKSVSGGSLAFQTDNKGYGYINITEDAKWHRIVYVREGTGANQFKGYLDGVLVNTSVQAVSNDIISTARDLKIINSEVSGTILLDDLQIFKGYAWNVGEVELDYVDGSGREADNLGVDVDLTLPVNNEFNAASSILFNATSTPLSNYSLVNSTFQIWHSNDTLLNETVVWINGTEANYTTVILNNLLADTYKWNVYACGTNETNNVCNYQITNNTLTRGFEINKETFNATVTTTTSQLYSLDINYSDTEFTLISGLFVYNNIPYVATRTGSGNGTLFSHTFNAPVVDSQQVKDFYWSLSLTSGSLTSVLNTTTQQQTVNTINGSILGSPYTVPFINFTIYDEDSLLPLNSTFSSTFQFGISTLNHNLTYGNTLEANSSYTFAFDPQDETFLMEGTIENEATGYITELYTLPQTTVTNATQNTSIYLLNSSRSTSFVIHVRDTAYSDIVGANVLVQRFYPGTNEWRTVEALETNAEGKSIGHFVTEEVNYRFQVYVNNVLQLVSTPTKIFCESSPCTITLTIESTLGDGFAPFQNLTDLTSTLDYSKTTEIFTYTYTDVNSQAQGGRLLVIRSNFGLGSPVTICDEVSGATSAVLTCDISSQTNATYIATAYNNRTSDEAKIVHRIVFQKTRDIVSEIGVDGLLWSAFILMSFVMIGLFSPALAIIFAIVGLVGIWLLEIASIPIVALVAIIIVGIIILWIIRGRR